MKILALLVVFLGCLRPGLSFAVQEQHVPVFSVQASVEVAGAITDEAATAIATARAELGALAEAMRFLAHLPYVQLAGANDGSAVFLPPLLDGLAWEVFSFTRQEAEMPSHDTGEKVVRGRVTAVFTGTDVHAAVTEAMKKRAILERYSASLHLQEEALQRAESLLLLLRKSGHTPSARQTKEQLRNEINSLWSLFLYRSLLPDYAGLWANPEKLRVTLTEALKKTPDNPLLLGAMAEIALQKNRVTEAQERIEKALEEGWRFAFLHDIHGLVYLRQQLPLLASQAFGVAIAGAPRDPQYRLHRASALLLMGESEAMCADFREACVQGDCSGLQWARGQGYCLAQSGSLSAGMDGATALEPLLYPDGQPPASDALREKLSMYPGAFRGFASPKNAIPEYGSEEYAPKGGTVGSEGARP